VRHAIKVICNLFAHFMNRVEQLQVVACLALALSSLFLSGVHWARGSSLYRISSLILIGGSISFLGVVLGKFRMAERRRIRAYAVREATQSQADKIVELLDQLKE
jgi:hypothetical protein